MIRHLLWSLAHLVGICHPCNCGWIWRYRWAVGWRYCLCGDSVPCAGCGAGC